MNKNNQNKIGIYFFIIILLITVVYTYYQTRSFIKGPVLEIEAPLNGSLLTTNSITIKGYTENISYISINNRQTFVDENGYLNERLLLSPGYNIIKVSAKDKYQREIEKKLELIYLKT
ncbi:MAG: hypothetical protein KAS02_00165 [Candidatus Pacebacteria bacterium]|nr:hypothetical protein [Candidatus Paceibacterota bacterium]